MNAQPTEIGGEPNPSLPPPAPPPSSPLLPPAAGFAPFFSVGEARTIHGRFEEIVQRYPTSTALLAGNDSWSYQRLNAAANRIAHRLLAAGVRCGQPMPLIAGHHPHAVAAYLGICKAGGAVVPLDRNNPTGLLARFQADCGAPLLLTDAASAGDVHDFAASAGCAVLVLGQEAGQPDRNPEVAVAPQSPFAIIYSSGTTGTPKGVLLTHEQRLYQTGHYADAIGLGPGDRFSFLHPLHSAGSMADFVAGLLVGATMVMFDAQEQGMEPMARWVRGMKLTVFHWIASGFRRFAANLAPEERFTGLRLVILGSEPALDSDLAAYQRHFAPPCRFINRFAAAESGCFSYYTADHSTLSPGPVLPVGKCINGWTVEVVDPEGRILPAGDEGRLVIRSAFLSSGYWQRPDLTSAVFSPVPGTHERLWKTSDLAIFRSDGNLVHLGRGDAVIKISGRNVSLLEVEAVLLRHPQVAEAAVIGHPRPGREPRIVAYVVASERHQPTAAELREFAAAQLIPPAVPSRFVFLPALPHTRTGKVDRAALPDPGRGRPTLAQAFAPPETPIEESLAEIWSTVLDVTPVGRLDPFLELGGASLAAAQIAARLSDRWGVTLTPAQVFTTGTVAALAELVTEALADRLAPALLDEWLDEAKEQGS